MVRPLGLQTALDSVQEREQKSRHVHCTVKNKKERIGLTQTEK